MRETRKTVDGSCSRSTEVLSTLNGAFSLNGQYYLQRRQRRDYGYVVPVHPQWRKVDGGGYSDNRRPRDQHYHSTSSVPLQGGVSSLLVSAFSFLPTSPSVLHGC